MKRNNPTQEETTYQRFLFVSHIKKQNDRKTEDKIIKWIISQSLTWMMKTQDVDFSLIRLFMCETQAGKVKEKEAV